MEGVTQGINEAQVAVLESGFEFEAEEAGRLTAEILTGVVENGENVPFAPAELLLYIINSVFGALEENSGMILSLSAVCLAVVLLSGLTKQNGLVNKSSATVGMASAVGLPAAIIFATVFMAAKKAMSSLEAVGLAVLPVVAAAGKGAGSYGFVACAQLMSFLLRHLFLPFIGIYAIIVYTSSVSGESMLLGICASMKKFFSWGLGMVMTLFSFCSVSSGLALNAASTLGAQTVKYAGSMVPVVGNYLTETADTVIASTALIRTAGGVCASLAVILVGLSPFVTLLSYYFAVNVINAVVGIFGCGTSASSKIKGIIERTSELIGMVIGITALMAAFFIINIAVIAR